MKKIIKIEPAGPAEPHKTKVAAYCRVSTATDSQLESLEAQKEHYETYIRAHDDWEFAGLYYDEGISGVKKEARSDLMRMLEDCRQGKIEFILTKSISRFSRNRIDCLSMARELLGMGIGIYFEKENLNTKTMDDELLLTIFSSLAEAESESISSNEKWSIRKRMEMGTYLTATPPYGYRMEDGKMVIDEEKADVVRYMFRRVLEGAGAYVLAKELEAKGIPGPKGGRWHQSTILKILQNERYIGDCLFQKTYTDPDFNRRKNRGEKDQFYVENHHECSS